MAFMNVGGVRAPLLYAPSGTEAPGEVTYSEAYAVAPFGNLLVTLTMTGADIEAVLNQQGAAGRGRVLALGVSEGFTYTWDAATQTVVPGSMALNGVPISPTGTYQVSTLSFLAEGGDAFTAFTNATALVGGPEDLANLVAYLRAHPGLTAPADRVTGL
jgi:5'-nucleotidase